MQKIIEIKIRQLAPFCWATFALVQIGTESGELSVYSFSSDRFPTGQQITEITVNGNRLPSPVAAHYFSQVKPLTVAAPLVSVTASTVAA